jgi:hypothetical protein
MISHPQEVTAPAVLDREQIEMNEPSEARQNASCVRDLIASLRTALAAEREAVRKLDAKSVARLSLEKQRIIGALMGSDPAARRELADALGPLREELRRNLILLAFARDHLSDAIATVRPRAAGARVSVEL